ncbi:MAG: hypothetical protein RLY64_385 [Bacteroidota bacterium]|jgi:hypothetical protein
MNQFTAVGRLVQVLEEVSGVGKTGNSWKKQSFVVELDGSSTYPKKVCLTAWGDKVDTLKRLTIGDRISAAFDVESREYQGRWYSDLKAWKIDVEANRSTGGGVDPFDGVDVPPMDNSSPASLPDENDLPF